MWCPINRYACGGDCAWHFASGCGMLTALEEIGESLEKLNATLSAEEEDQEEEP